MRADLDHYVSGDEIAVSLRGYETAGANLSRLDPSTDEVWEIRVHSAEPQQRVFGRFAWRDTFVAFSWSDRSEFETPEDWDDEKEFCQREWMSLFPNFQPIHGSEANVYISEPFYTV